MGFYTYIYIYMYPLGFGSTGHFVGCCGNCPKHDHDLQHVLQHGMLQALLNDWVGGYFDITNMWSDPLHDL